MVRKIVIEKELQKGWKRNEKPKEEDKARKREVNSVENKGSRGSENI